MAHEFKSFPKIPRLEKLSWSITEKLDGTNGIIEIVKASDKEWGQVPSVPPETISVVERNGDYFAILAGSRSRWLNPEVKGGDNYGFGGWVQGHAKELFNLLGVGTHYGEWWGNGIQRGYGLSKKYFTLFNPQRYPHLPPAFKQIACDNLLGVVPTLYTGAGTSDLTHAVEFCISGLMGESMAVPGFKHPEGFVLRLGDKLHKVIINDGPKDESRDEVK